MQNRIRLWKRSEATKAETEFATEKPAWNGEDTPQSLTAQKVIIDLSANETTARA